MADKEYIEREALAEDLRGSYEELRKIYNGLHFDDERRICFAELTTFMECIMRVKEATTADVVEVVRCKDCAYANDAGTICHYWVGRETDPMGYCHKGAKMDGKGEGE